MKTTTLRLPDEDDVRLQAYAREREISMNQAILELMRRALDQPAKGPSFSFSSGQQYTPEEIDDMLHKGLGKA